MNNVLFVYLLIFFSLCDCIFFCNIFNNSIKNFGVPNVTYFVYRPMPIRDIETDMPQDLLNQ